MYQIDSTQTSVFIFGVIGALLLSLLVRRNQAIVVAAAAVIATFALVPLNVAPEVLSVVIGTASVLLPAIALTRSGTPLAIGVSGIMLFALLLQTAFVTLLAGNYTGALRGFLIAIVTVLSISLFRALDQAGRVKLSNFALVTLLGLITIGVLEAFQITPPLWSALSDASSTLNARVNSVAPWLPGRAIGTQSHPTTYAVALFVCAGVAVSAPNTNGVRYLLVTIALLPGLVVSGTRSVLIALIITAIYMFLANARHRSHRIAIGVLTAPAILAIFDVIELVGLNGVQNTLSYTQRSAVWVSAKGLLERPLLEVLFGSGNGSVQRLFSEGFLQGAALSVIDNQYITTLATSGLVGLFLLISSIIVSFAAGDRIGRAFTIFTAITFLSYDGLQHEIGLLALIYAIARIYLKPISRIDLESKQEKQYGQTWNLGLTDSRRL